MNILNEKEKFEAVFCEEDLAQSGNAYYSDETSLLWTGWMRKAESIDEFVCLPRVLTDEKADQIASAKFNEIKGMFDYENRDLSATERETLRLRWCKNRAKAFQEIYSMMIQAHTI